MANRNHKAAIEHAANANTPNAAHPSSKLSQSRDKNDELIVTLSDAYENRRAQQVG